MSDTTTDHDELDGCDLDFGEDVMVDDEADLFVLFAEALDPTAPVSVDDAAIEWKELFS